MRRVFVALAVVVLSGVSTAPAYASALHAPSMPSEAKIVRSQSLKKTVSDANELKNALCDESVTEIVLNKDIDVKDVSTYVYEEGPSYRHFKAALFANHSLVLDLNGHALTDSKHYRSVLAVGSHTVGRPIDFVIKDTGNGADAGNGVTGRISKTSDSSASGGAITVRGEQTKLTLIGGTIADSHAREGGGISIASATVVMEGGVISGNRAVAGRAGNGGGVYVGNDASFQLKGGRIEANAADQYGGAVYVGLGAAFTMTGGSIADNFLEDVGLAKGGGAGLYMDGAAKVELAGGSIINNTARFSKAQSFVGGGVYVPDNRSNVLISGPVKISGNKGSQDKGSEIDSNLVLDRRATIEVSALPARGGVHIAVLPKPAQDHVSVKVAEGVLREGHLKDYFVSDVADFALSDKGVWGADVKPEPEKTQLKLTTDPYSPTYGDIVTVTVQVRTVSDKPVASGLVSLSANGDGCGEQAVDSSGRATFSIDTANLLTSYTFKASYQGNDEFAPSTASKSILASQREVRVSGAKAARKSYDGTSSIDLDVSNVSFVEGVLPKDEGKLRLAVYPGSAFAADEEGQEVSDAGTHNVGVSMASIVSDDSALADCYELAYEKPFVDTQVTIDPVSNGENGYRVEALLDTSAVTEGDSFSKVGAHLKAVGVDGEELPGKVGWFSDAEHTHAITADDVFDKVGTCILYWTFTPESANYRIAEGNVSVTVQEAPQPDPVKTSVKAALTQSRVSYGDALEVKAQVRADDGKASGTVRVRMGDAVLAQASLDDTGGAVLTIPTSKRTVPLGNHKIIVEYVGVDGLFLPSSTECAYILDPREVGVASLRILNRPFDGTDDVKIDAADLKLQGVVGQDDLRLEVLSATSLPTGSLDAAAAGVHPVAVDARLIDHTATDKAHSEGYYRLSADAFSGLTVTISPAHVGESGYGVRADDLTLPVGSTLADLVGGVKSVGVDGQVVPGNVTWYWDGAHADSVATETRFDTPGNITLYWVFDSASDNYEEASGSIRLSIVKKDDGKNPGGAPSGDVANRPPTDSGSHGGPLPQRELVATGDIASIFGYVAGGGMLSLMAGAAVLRRRSSRK